MSLELPDAGTQPCWPCCRPVGDTGLLVEFGNAIDPRLHDRVVALDHALALAELPGIVETVPTYRSLLVEFEPLDTSFDRLKAEIAELLAFLPHETRLRQRRLQVPVCYDGRCGEDLPEAAALLGLDPAAAIEAHLGAEYRVYMIGFMPGFAYLGGLAPALSLPRRPTPRSPVPAGTVMIGGGQAAIAALPTPTGWYAIGRTPARGFDRLRADPFLFRPGDMVRLRRVCGREFDELEAGAAAGKDLVEMLPP